MKRRLLLVMVVALLASGSTAAQDTPSDLTRGADVAKREEAELKRLQSVLAILNDEQAAQYQQIEPLLRAIRDNAQIPSAYLRRVAPDPLSYTVDQIEAERRQATQREAELNARLDAIYARIKEIDAQKQPIFARLRELIRSGR